MSPWIAGIFLAAVGAVVGEPRFLVKMRKWLQWSVHRDRLQGMRVFTRGECQWLGAACPPSKPKGNNPWLLHWGHSFFLVTAELDSIDTAFVQALCGYGPKWQCKAIITPADPSQFRLPLVTVIGDVAAIKVQLCGVFQVDPGDTIGSIYWRAALSPKSQSLSFDNSHPALNTPVWTVVEDDLTGSLSLQGPAPIQPKGIRLIFRDEVHDIQGQVGMSFADAIIELHCLFLVTRKGHRSGMSSTKKTCWRKTFCLYKEELFRLTLPLSSSKLNQLGSLDFRL